MDFVFKLIVSSPMVDDAETFNTLSDNITTLNLN